MFSIHSLRGCSSSNDSINSSNDGVINLSVNKGIIRFTISYDNKPSKVIFNITPWAERLEGLTLSCNNTQHDLLESDMVLKNIENGSLHVELLENSLKLLENGSVFQFIDFYR